MSFLVRLYAHFVNSVKDGWLEGRYKINRRSLNDLTNIYLRDAMTDESTAALNFTHGLMKSGVAFDDTGRLLTEVRRTSRMRGGLPSGRPLR